MMIFSFMSWNDKVLYCELNSFTNQPPKPISFSINAIFILHFYTLMSSPPSVKNQSPPLSHVLVSVVISRR
ncbi:hypothetical protein HanIR_Chr10g0464931 [Helianthus annuus]|nr:hypothetical protein HanIR_Chr10g0464931 [Helianthus annuus]